MVGIDRAEGAVESACLVVDGGFKKMAGCCGNCEQFKHDGQEI